MISIPVFLTAQTAKDWESLQVRHILEAGILHNELDYKFKIKARKTRIIHSLNLTRQSTWYGTGRIGEQRHSVLLQVLTVYKRLYVCAKTFAIAEHLRYCIDRKLGKWMPCCLTFIKIPLLCSFSGKQKRCNNIKQQRIKAGSFNMAFQQPLSGSKAHRTRKAKVEAASPPSLIHTLLLSIFSPVSLKFWDQHHTPTVIYFSLMTKQRQPCQLM